MACSDAEELGFTQSKKCHDREHAWKMNVKTLQRQHMLHCVFSKKVWTWCFTKCVLFFAIVEGKKTWGTHHTIFLRNVGRKNDVGLAPTKKTLSYRRKKKFQTPCTQRVHRRKVSKHALVSQTNASIAVTKDRWEWLPHRVRLVICLIIE